jgi:hypothetical protein
MRFCAVAVTLRFACVQGLYAVDANKRGQLARVKQREWKKHRVDTIEAAPEIAAPGFTPLGYFLPPRPGRGSHRRKEEVKEAKEVEERGCWH